MSGTFTWPAAATAAKTGTTNATCITDMKSAIDSVSGNSAYKWQSASSSTAGPLYLVLKPKNGDPGRLLFVIWATAPAGNNAAILQGAPTTGSLYCAWFPAGNVDSPSNLTASSGTILGDDTGVVKVCSGLAITTIYAASIVPFWWDSGTSDGGFFTFNNPASAATYAMGGGKLVVDASDVAYDCDFSTSTSGWNALQSSDPFAFVANSTTITAGGITSNRVTTNYGQTDDYFFTAWLARGWGAQVAGSSDTPLEDNTNTKVYFVPYQLVSRRKGVGFALKFRQLAIGPTTSTANVNYSTSGVVQARCTIAATAGGGSSAVIWVTNFKI